MLVELRTLLADTERLRASEKIARDGFDQLCEKHMRQTEEAEALRALVREYVACSPGIWESRTGRRDSDLDVRARKALGSTT